MFVENLDNNYLENSILEFKEELNSIETKEELNDFLVRVYDFEEELAKAKKDIANLKDSEKYQSLLKSNTGDIGNFKIAVFDVSEYDYSKNAELLMEEDLLENINKKVSSSKEIIKSIKDKMKSHINGFWLTDSGVKKMGAVIINTYKKTRVTRKKN